MSAPITFPKSDQLPETVRVDSDGYERRWLVNGELRKTSGPTLAIEAAVCVEEHGKLVRPVLGHVPDLSAEEALEAMEAARAAWGNGRGEWPSASLGERLRAIELFNEKLLDVREEVVRLLMWEIGKTRADAEKEFDRTHAYTKDTVRALKELDRSSARFQVEEGILGQIRRSPLGVVLCMGPYNYPLNETYTTLIPALAMGNTVVAKLPRFGQLLHLPTYRAFQESFPKGVVNFVSGNGARIIGPMLESGHVDVLAFIGSGRVADTLKKKHPAPHRLRSVLGLGAKNAGIVLKDADLDVAVRECASGALSFNGQRCTALKTLYVEREIAGIFVEKLAQAVDAMKAGLPWEPGVKLTPLPEDGKGDYLQGLVEDAVLKGARVVNAHGGARSGTYFHPAVLFPCDASMRAAQEEQFGPVVPVIPFERDEEPIDAVTNSPYGQQASVFGRDPARMAKFVDALVTQVSRVNLNSQCQRGPDVFPFTGRKDSAEGTLSVSDALRVFSIRTLVAAKDDAANRELVGTIVRERRSAFLNTDFIF